jgi:hypothetical protein
MADYTIIRNLRGNWPNWCADLDDGRVVFIYIRYGEVRVGVGTSDTHASEVAKIARSGDEYGGVTEVLTALTVLDEMGYHYVCPS